MGRNGMFNTSLDYYNTFYYVTKYKSISLAAKQLSLAQPTVSNTIKRLESNLECKLFDRSRSGVLLTPEGEALWKKVEPACELILEGERELESRKNENGGTINIVAYEQGFILYIMPALRIFLRDHPEVNVKLFAKQQEKMTEMVKIGLADLTLLFSPMEPEPELCYSRIGQFQERLAAGREFEELKGKKLSLKDIAHYPMITYSSGSAKVLLQQFFEEKGILFNAQMEVTGVSLMRQAIINNFGIGDIVPQMAQEAYEQGKLFFLELGEPLPERQVYVVTGKTPNQATRLFVEDYLPHFQDIAKE